MTKEEALERVENIRGMTYDPETAHIAEDNFRADVLEAIANGSPDAAELARIALSTDDIGFARWYA